VLLANWYYKATMRALEGDAKLKYFQHAGALLTADGTDDDLIQLEGTLPDYTYYNYIPHFQFKKLGRVVPSALETLRNSASLQNPVFLMPAHDCSSMA
jgi:hypothetical protein